MKFRVIDKKTGKEADPYEIALHEEWAQRLCYCDMDGFAILEDGTLLLVDECGQFEYCDADRFEVVLDDERTHGEWVAKSKRIQVDETDEERIFETRQEWFCSSCGKSFGLRKPEDAFCKYCGSDNRGKEGDKE